MPNKDTSDYNTPIEYNSDVSLLQQITPLARQINCLDIENIGTICTQNIPKLVGAKFASLYILDELNNMLHLLKYNHPFSINKIVSLNQNPPSPMVMAVQSKQLIRVNNIDTHREPIIRKSQRHYIDNYKTKNCVITPLLCQERVVGVLNLSDTLKNCDFSDEDIALIELFSQLIGASIGNIKMFEKTQLQAKSDGLTGLANHRTLYEELERELWRCRRYGNRLSLIMIDVDNLKHINDAFGHRAGDKVIKQISQKITSCIRQVDIASRYGGDEFAVILPNTTISKAQVVADRMLDSVSQSPIKYHEQDIHVTISVGLGEYGSENTPEQITSFSDQAMYNAKKAGKNTLRLFQPVKS